LRFSRWARKKKSRSKAPNFKRREEEGGKGKEERSFSGFNLCIEPKKKKRGDKVAGARGGGGKEGGKKNIISVLQVTTDQRKKEKKNSSTRKKKKRDSQRNSFHSARERRGEKGKTQTREGRERKKGRERPLRLYSTFLGRDGNKKKKKKKGKGAKTFP